MERGPHARRVVFTQVGPKGRGMGVQAWLSSLGGLLSQLEPVLQLPQNQVQALQGNLLGLCGERQMPSASHPDHFPPTVSMTPSPGCRLGLTICQCHPACSPCEPRSTLGGPGSLLWAVLAFRFPFPVLCPFPSLCSPSIFIPCPVRLLSTLSL